MSQSICSSRSYVIDPKFSKSPYLSKPFGRTNDRSRRSGASAKATPDLIPAKDEKVAARGDVSVGSYRSVRSTRTTARRPYQQGFGLNDSARQKQALLLPRETTKLLRSFRQKVQSKGGQEQAAADGDDSSICTDDCASLDDRAVFVSINSCEKAREYVFSGPVFAELSLQEKRPGPNALPPLTVSSEPDDVSDLESLASKQPETRRRKKRTNRRRRR